MVACHPVFVEDLGNPQRGYPEKTTMRKRRNRNRNNQKPPNKVGDNKPVAAIPTPLGSDQEKQKLDHLWLLVPILGTLFGSATGFLAKDHPIKAAWCFVIGATIILFGWAWIGKQRTQSLVGVKVFL